MFQINSELYSNIYYRWLQKNTGTCDSLCH